MNDQIILDKVIEEFLHLTKIPRKSGHEEAVGQYLLRRAQALGLTAVRDETGNVIVEKPAAPGYENAPTTILQAHMDMVCVAAEEKAYDPLRDAIEVVRDDAYLSADGTSLGADDGMGIAIIFYLLQADVEHGPLRAIFTVDEEEGMGGAKALDAKYLDADYLINCDSEDFDILTVSSAGSVGIDFLREPTWKKPVHTRAYRISAKGFIGGHSGIQINYGRANAARVLALTLDRIQAAGIDAELADFTGGTAGNAIPANASAIIVIDDASKPAIDEILEEMKRAAAEIYGNVEKDFTIVMDPAQTPSEVLSAKDRTRLIRILCLLQIGVHSMKQSGGGLVETSANMGIVRTRKDTLQVRFFPRSAIDASIEEIKQINAQLADALGFKIECAAQSPGWPENPKSKLAPLIAEVFKAQNRMPMKVDAIHAGLECSWFYLKNPKLDIVSIGPTITGAHSPQERIELATVVPHVRLIVETLKRIK